MKLNFKKLGEGKPLLILHGLFGSLDNWMTLGKQFAATNFSTYLIDARNHGHSFHSNEFNYHVMTDDLVELIAAENLSEVILLGHSMGGKTCMNTALNHPELVSRLIVVDIATRYYPVHHTTIINSLKQVDFEMIKTRNEAEKILADLISDFGTRQFLLKNLYWKNENELAWRFNLNAIEKNIESVGFEIKSDFPFSKPALFIRGQKSNYISDDDFFEIKLLFPQVEIKTIEGAGHWVHADKPKEFFASVNEFCLS